MKKEAGKRIGEMSKEVDKVRVDNEGGENLEGESRVVRVDLGEEETRQLLKEAGKAYHTQVSELLMAAVVKSLREWGGMRRVRIDVEGHGREEIGEGIDLTRTVGWFTSVYPVEIDIESEEKIGEQIKKVKEQLRKAPRNGIGYGLLRYLREDQMGRGLRKKRAEIRYKYLGQLDLALEAEGRFSPAIESVGEDVNEQIEIDDLLEMNIGVIGGRLEVAIIYNEDAHPGKIAVKLARDYREALEEIIAHCMRDDSGGYTPSDFPDSGLTQDALDQLIEEINKMYD